jgi:hypothetical protein
MANTVIQLKYSSVTNTPPSLNVGEPAYSFSSNTLFIGDSSNNAIAIGGKYYVDQQALIYTHANAAYDQANTTTTFGVASFNHANAAYDQANTATTNAATADSKAVTAGSYANSAFVHSNSAFTHANSGYDQANTATTNAATADAKAVSAGSYANSAYDQANTATTNAATADSKAVTAGSYANSAFVHANSAYARANSSLNANTGGTIDGNLVITGNLSVTGNTTTYNVDTYTVNDPIILLANNSFSDVLDIGFTAHYSSNSVDQLHTGLVRHAATDKYYLFEGYEPHLLDDNILDVNDASLVISTLRANIEADSLLVNGANVKSYIDSSFAAANTADAKATSAGSYANSAYNQANTATTNAATADDKAVTAGSYANSAFLAANTAQTHAQAAFNQANTATTDAATADSKAVSAGSYANSAFVHANSAFDKANTDATNVSITAGDFGSASIVPTFHVTANGRIDSVGNVTIALAASQITSGELSVARGGTGAGTHTLNGVLLGQGTSALTTASSSTEGHVLTINGSGVPTFQHLSGGTF